LYDHKQNRYVLACIGVVCEDIIMHE